MGLIRELVDFVKSFFGSATGVVWVLFVIFGNASLDWFGLISMLGFNLLALGLPAAILLRRRKRSEEAQAASELQISTDRQTKAIDSYVSLVHDQTEKQHRKRSVLQRFWDWF
jgi:hypothetical protein